MDLTTIEYTVLTGQENGNPVTYRAIYDPKDLKELCPHLVNIKWHFESANKGLPSKAENKRLTHFEDTLDKLETESFGVLAVVIVGNNRKEWNWFVKDIESWKARMHELLNCHNAYPIEFKEFKDDNWGFHSAFKKWAKLT